MSIYSGFATRKMQENYNGLAFKLISLLQDHLIEFLSLIQYDKLTLAQRHQLPCEKKLKKCNQILMKMSQYEQHKYLEPKFSLGCNPLKKLIQKTIYQSTQQSEQDQKNSRGKLSSSGITLKSTFQGKIIKKSTSIQKREFAKTHTAQFRQNNQGNIKYQRLSKQRALQHQNIYKNSPYKKYSQCRTQTQPGEIGQKKEIQEFQNIAISVNISHNNSVIPNSRPRIHRSYDKSSPHDSNQRENYQNSQSIFKRSNMTTKIQNSQIQSCNLSMNQTQFQINEKRNASIEPKQNNKSKNSRLQQYSNSRNKGMPTSLKSSNYKKYVNRTQLRKSLKQEDNYKTERYLSNESGTKEQERIKKQKQ